jgi:hypothetical protein
VVRLSVDSDRVLVGIERLSAVVTLGGRDSLPADFRLPPGSVAIPPPQSVDLVFPPEHTGRFTVRVDALDGAGRALATGRTDGEARAGEDTSADVFLLGGTAALGDGAVPDDALPDGAPPVDLAPP